MELCSCSNSLLTPTRYTPDCVSFWGTEEWKSLQKAANLELYNVHQGDFEPWKSDAPVKPTGLAANFEVRLPGERNPEAKGRNECQKAPSSSLSRWVPGLCRSIAEACSACLNEEGPTKLKKMTWEQRHVPFRRDLSSAKSRPHRKVAHPLAATLSLDSSWTTSLGQGWKRNCQIHFGGNLHLVVASGSTPTCA